MVKRICTEPEAPVDPSVHGDGTYRVIYKRANGTPEYGEVRKVRAGDVVEFFDEGIRKSEVKEVVGKGAKARVRTKPQMFQGMVIRKGQLVYLSDLRLVLRLRDDLEIVIDPEDMSRKFIPKEIVEVLPPPPLPEVVFAPVENPNRPKGSIPLTPQPNRKIVGPIKTKKSVPTKTPDPKKGKKIDPKTPDPKKGKKVDLKGKKVTPTIQAPDKSSAKAKRQLNKALKDAAKVPVSSETPMQKWKRLKTAKKRGTK